MMRILFFFLVVSSLALAWLALQQPEPDEANRVAVNLPRVAHLQMVSEGEMVSEALPSPGSTAGRNSGETGKAQVEASTEASGASNNNVDERKSGFPHGLPDLLAGFSFDEFLASDSEEPRIPSSSPSPEGAPGKQGECVVVEGFENATKARLWLKAANAQSELEGEVQQRTVIRKPLHWVLVPPLDTRKEGLELLRSLQRRGLDSYLITQGEKANAVSLGLFESLRAAKAVLRQRREQGLEVVLTEYPRTREIDFVVLENANLSVLRELVPEGVDARIETDACKVLQ